MPKLTKTVVDGSAVRASSYYVWCSDLKGFGVRIWPTGRKVYSVDYYPRKGSRKRIVLGEHGKLTAEQARKLAVITLADVLKGEDPGEERQTRRKSLTIAQLCDNYMRAVDDGLVIGKRGKPKKGSTIATDRGRIDRHIKPLLGRKLVKELTRADVTKFIRDVTVGKTAVVVKTKKSGKAVVEGGAGTATRTVGLLGGILSFAVVDGVIDFNPVHGVKKPSYNKRKRRLTADEFAALGQALRAADEQIAQVRLGCWLLCLTGCRLGEIVNLKWSDVDFNGHCLRLEDTKEGPSVRPIGQDALSMLMRQERSEQYVLPAERGGKGGFSSLGKAFIRIAKSAGLAGVTAHTMRHSFSSESDDLGFSRSTTDALVGHSDNSMSARYIHKIDTTLVAAADSVCRSIYTMMDTV